MEKGARLSQTFITCHEFLDQVLPGNKAAIRSKHLQGAHQLQLEWVCTCCKKFFGSGWFLGLSAHPMKRHSDQDNYWEAKFLLLSPTKKDNHPRDQSSGGKKGSRETTQLQTDGLGPPSQRPGLRSIGRGLLAGQESAQLSRGGPYPSTCHWTLRRNQPAYLPLPLGLGGAAVPAGATPNHPALPHGAGSSQGTASSTLAASHPGPEGRGCTPGHGVRLPGGTPGRQAPDDGDPNRRRLPPNIPRGEGENDPLV